MMKGKHLRGQWKTSTVVVLMTLGCNGNAVNKEGWDKRAACHVEIDNTGRSLNNLSAKLEWYI